MRKTLKFALVISIILALLMGNVSVLAVNIMYTLPDENANVTSDDTKDSNAKQINNENEISTEKESEGGVKSDKNSEAKSDENANSTVDNKETSNTVASDANSETNNVVNSDKSEADFSESENKNVLDENNEKLIENDSTTETSTGSGKIVVQLDLRLPSSKVQFDLKLKQGNADLQKTFTLDESDKDDEKRTDTTLFYTSEELNEGTYTLEISHSGYVTYTQSIQVSPNTVSKISLTNGYNSILSQTQVGLISLGDVNKDGSITGYNANGEGSENTDEALMIDQISEYSNDSAYDLNGDGKVDIIDLSYISNNKNQNNQDADVLQSVDVSNANIEVKENLVDETNGTIEDILKNNDKYVTLKPKNAGEDISDTNPIEFSISMDENINTLTKEIIIAPSINPENNIKAGTILVETTDGRKIEAIIGNEKRTYSPVAKIANEKGNANIEPDGTISVDLGGKVAVKKVTIRVTATESNTLADISQVEFLNGYTDRIPPPEIVKPEIVDTKTTGESFTVIWNHVTNVTGYEVRITAKTNNQGEKTQEYSVDGNSITISDFFGAVKDNIPCTYRVAVQSVNGKWRSGYGTEKEVKVTEVSKPDKPDYVTVKGGVRELEVSWKKMNATNSYKVFYREYQNNDNFEGYTEATKGMKLTNTSYTISNLKDSQKYQVYVIGVNSKGESPRSNVAVGETTNIEPAVLPAYKLINTPNEYGKLTSHIEKVVLKPWVNAYMVDSPLDFDSNGNPKKVDSGTSALGVVDNSYDSYLQVDDWDFGGYYSDYGTKGIEVTFDNTYKMNYFTFAQIQNLGDFSNAKIWYKDKATGKMINEPISASQVVTKKGKDSERHYTTIKLPEPIETDTVQIAVGRGSGYIRKITIAEMRFYEYDSLEDDINGLYSDQMHTTLRPDVDEQDFEDLQSRLNTRDEASGEYHPEKDSLQKELDLAKLIYETSSLKDVVKIDTTVTGAKDSHITFKGGLNAWQPLGIVAHGEETIKVFVGNPAKHNGDSTNLNLIATQYHAEASKWMSEVVKSLKIGLNEITIPKIDSTDKESGGSLYIEYTGNNPNDVYGVRVVGGENIPVLDLSKLDRKDETARRSAVKEYVQKLTEVVPKLSQAHEEHRKNGGSSLNYDYDEKNCILGATEIVLDQMMYSVSSKQILEGLGNGTLDDKTSNLYNSLVAMEDMVDLFYQHKGLNKDTTKRDTNTYPSSRLNIRYHQMFGGAAMYAGGKHIGIEWGDVPTLSKGNPIIKTSENGIDGKYNGGNYFGWGIAHEIGHIINESAYVHGEVTNNYFSILSQAKDTNDSVRFEYPEVYKKVMSGKTGKAQNVFTQLALYWQLHLAYDMDGFNFKTYDDYEEQTKNLLFARMDSYARNPISAPKAEGEKGIALTLTNSNDDNLIRLACAGAQRNLLEFFYTWGMEPNPDTEMYASQWQEETRPIYFINDEARAYQLTKKPTMTSDTTVSATITNASENGIVESGKVELSISNTNEQPGAMLGYEIVRTYMDNNVEVEVPVAFVTMENEENGTLTYTDTIETVNNRVFTYKITGYDKYLSETKQLVLDPIKVEHDGTLGEKSKWTVTTNLKSSGDKEMSDKDSNLYDVSDGPVTVKDDSKLIDGKTDADYKGTIETDKETGKPVSNNAEITIEIEKDTKLVGYKLTTASGKLPTKYTVQISSNGKDWSTVKTVEKSNSIFKSIFSLFSTKSNENAVTEYFGDGDALEVHKVTYIKFIIEDTNVSIAEIDLIGQTGDNVDFMKDENGNYSGYGILQEDFQLGTSDETNEAVTIPKNSIVFTGTYKGNPAYNVLKLWIQNGETNELLTGSYQVFFIDKPLSEDALLTDVADGTWVCWLEENIYMDENGNQVNGEEDGGTLQNNPYYEELKKEVEGRSVRAELYRVDNAHTNEGERITSDSFRMPISAKLPDISLNDSEMKQ